MASKTCRLSMPAYAEREAIVVSGQQLHKILRGRNLFKRDSPNYATISRRSAYRVTQLRDGTWWVENFRAGAPLFAPDYWWRMPKVAGERTLKLKEFVDANL